MKSDPTFLRGLVALVVLSVVFFLIERVAGRGRPPPKMTGRGGGALV